MFTYSSKTDSNKKQVISASQQNVQNVMQLQHAMGNSGVLQLLQSRSIRRPAGLPIQRTEDGSDTSNALAARFRIPGQFRDRVQKMNDPEMEQHENTTGLPDNLKAGVENLSGITMDDVRVHYNSDKPKEVGALAYTQGSDIHVASGQEKNLPHEAWHVVQQSQGRVQATMQMRGADVNDDVGLEKEADEMGNKAIHFNFPTTQTDGYGAERSWRPASRDTVQRKTMTLLRIAPGSQGGGKAVIQRASLTIGEIKHTKQKEVDDIVKTVQDYEKNRDLYLSQVFFQQDRIFKTQEDFFAELVKQRPSFMLTEKYWKDKAVLDEIEDTNAYQQSQVGGFWDSYTGKKGTPRDVSAIISDTGKKLLDEVGKAGKKTDEQLRLYRGMKKDEGLAIIRWFYGQKAGTEEQMKGSTLNPEDLVDPSPTKKVGIIPVKHHLGGFEQAQNYGQSEDEVVIEFTLKKGAHDVIFKPEYMALAPAGKGGISAMAADSQYHKKPFPTGSKSEGELAGHIGIKSESKGPFSFSLGDSGASRLLFQLLIDQVKVVKGL